MTTIKTASNNRLIWWRKRADANYWYQHFAGSIERTHKRVTSKKYPGFVNLFVKHFRGMKVLEAGCGTGWVVSALRSEGVEAEGVDYSSELVQAVNQKYPDLPIHFGDVTALEIPDNTYDGYISLGVIEHRWEGSEPFLAEAKRIVRPGGMLFFSVPYYNVIRRMKYANKATPETDSLEFYQYGFTKPDFRSTLESSGFKVERFYFCGTYRLLSEEFPRATQWLGSHRFIWRYPRYLDHLDGLGLTHMIMAAVRNMK